MIKEMWNDSGMRILLILYALWLIFFVGSMFHHFTIIPWLNKKRIKEGKPLIPGVLGRKK